jgi:hypothetical protein
MLPVTTKRIILIVAVVACATLTWATARPWLESLVRFSSFAVILWPSLAVTLLAAVAGMAFALLDSKMDRLAAILASWATFIIFWSPDVWYVSALPLFLLLWWEGAKRIHDDVHERRKVRIRAALGHGVKFILLGAFLMVSVGFYLLPASQEADVSTISKGVQGGIEDAYDSPLVREQLAQLPPAAQTQFKQETVRSVDAFIRKWFGPVSGYIPPFLAFALFLVLWSTAFIFRAAAIWLGYGIFKLLKAAKFVTMTEEDIRADRVSL